MVVVDGCSRKQVEADSRTETWIDLEERSPREERGPSSIHHSLFTIYHLPFTIQHATFNVQHVALNIQLATFTIHCSHALVSTTVSLLDVHHERRVQFYDVKCGGDERSHKNY